MDIDDWGTIEPDHGEAGVTNVTVSAEPHTGREVGSKKLWIKNTADPNVKEPLNITQEGQAEFVSFSNVAEIVVCHTGGEIPICGLTNSKKLTFELCDDNLNVILPEEYNSGGVMKKNGSLIKNDPGAHHTFRFILEIKIPENTTGNLL